MTSSFNPTGTWGPKGRGFSMGVVQHSGYVVHLTGQVLGTRKKRLSVLAMCGRRRISAFETFEQSYPLSGVNWATLSR